MESIILDILEIFWGEIIMIDYEERRGEELGINVLSWLIVPESEVKLRCLLTPPSPDF